MRLEPGLHRLMAARAEKEGVSINGLCARLLKHGLQTKSAVRWWQGPCEDVVAELRRHFGSALIGVAVFGSQVQGTATDQSDLDLLIVLDPATPVRRSLYSWWDQNIKWQESVELSPQFVNLPISDEDAGGIWFEAALASEILWERGRALTNIFKRLRSLIETDRVRRHWLSGQAYWVRREDEESRPGA